MWACRRRIVSFRNSPAETSAAAPPPAPLKSATICGIAVILTMRAETRPIGTPMTAPMMISVQLTMPESKPVATTAIVMPAIARILPMRALRGELRNLSPRMKRTAVMR